MNTSRPVSVGITGTLYSPSWPSKAGHPRLSVRGTGQSRRCSAFAEHDVKDQRKRTESNSTPLAIDSTVSGAGAEVVPKPNCHAAYARPLHDDQIRGRTQDSQIAGQGRR